MAHLSHCPHVTSDVLRSSSNGVGGIPLIILLGRARLGVQRRKGFTTVTSMARKVKKHDYPWTSDPDPNVKGGVLTHLSHFKPLKDKPKQVTLEFEKPLMVLEKKIIGVSAFPPVFIN